MDDLILVGMDEAGANSFDNEQGLFGIDGLSFGGMGKRFSWNEFHDEIEHSFDAARVVNADEIGMIQLRHGAAGVFEARKGRRVLADVWRKDFDCDVAAERPLV